MKGKEPNYAAFIPIGICFMGSGVVFMTTVNSLLGSGMLIIGVAWMIIGIKNRNKTEAKK